MRTLKVILIKEFRQFFHNAFLPKLCVMFPLMVMLIMPLVTTMDVKHVKVSIVDQDHSTFTRNLANNIDASAYTSVAEITPTFSDAMKSIEDGESDIIIEIPIGYEASLKTRYPLSINISANSVNAIKGVLGMQYMQSIVMNELQKLNPYNIKASDTIRINELNLFNSTLDYKHYMIPALMIMLIVMICGFLSGLNIVSEKETGTIEQINVSPINQFTFTLGKIIPYWIIGFVVITIGIIVAWVVYSLTPLGNILIIYLASFLFILVMSSMSAIIANYSSNMLQVMFIMFFFVMVFILMSGLMTPISSMPEWAQSITYAMPPRYYVDIMRATYLRGASFSDQLFNFSALGAFSILLPLMAIISYRKRN